MTYILRSTFFVLSLALFAPVSAYADISPAFPHLIVKGEATYEVRPDKATLILQVSAFDPASAVATETVQRQLVALLEILATHSVPEDGITSYNLSKKIERERIDRVERKILGYYVSRKVKVELPELSNFAELVADIAALDSIAEIDARFDIADRDRHESRLLNEAGADARRTAEKMLHGMSRELSSVYAISESSWGSRVAQFSVASDSGYPLAMARYDASGFARTVFEPATIELRQTLHVIFELE